jgi:perosamine synthetase
MGQFYHHQFSEMGEFSLQPAQTAYGGMHEQPIFQGAHYPITEEISRKGFYLPSGLKPIEDQQTRVLTAVKEALFS